MSIQIHRKPTLPHCLVESRQAGWNTFLWINTIEDNRSRLLSEPFLNLSSALYVINFESLATHTDHVPHIYQPNTHALNPLPRDSNKSFQWTAQSKYVINRYVLFGSIKTSLAPPH